MEAVDYAARYSAMEEGDLAQIAWDGIDCLENDARHAFQAELERRGSTAAELKKQYPELAPPVAPPPPSKDTYIHALWFALKELRLRTASADWPHAMATVDSSKRSGPAPRGGVVRAEITYHFSVDGTMYQGTTVRDFIWSGNSELMVDRFGTGDSVEIRFNPDRPSSSYLPSGAGVLGSVVVGLIGILGLLLICFIMLAPLFFNGNRAR